MYWQAIWFGINILFVASLITTLFLHRSVSMARLEHAPETKIRKLTMIRSMLWGLTTVFFLGMSGAFLADMYYNG
ncbi:MAG: hypothetical protein NAG76_21080 [Candidatus Pristimantibacillus lignocellulolyticus]|uniref:Uncharacterized protein n=1 Tax=Candidatus Pristimantibacillus lignocellulolyticus TaxID=2994561 RepID=A0A9J6ZE03_9BACL|nr:MAG: hypothetical protein NAG76_21080 [Candidatus Pristimantibacillus lignocellulolyticus]